MTCFTNSLFKVYNNLSFKETGPEVYNTNNAGVTPGSSRKKSKPSNQRVGSGKELSFLAAVVKVQLQGTKGQLQRLNLKGNLVINFMFNKLYTIVKTGMVDGP